MKSSIIRNDSKITLWEYLKLIWQHRFFSYTLGVGGVKNKYAKTYTGILLSFIQTSITLGVYWLVFGVIIKVQTGTIPYPLFVLSGLILWQYFSNTVNAITWALIDSENLISKLYFPRINIIFSRMINGTVDLIIGGGIFFVMLVIYSQPVSYKIAFVPFVIIILLINTLSVGLWTSIISLYFRDISHVLVQLVSFFIFITPVFYPGTIIPQHLKILLYINPMAGTIEVFRSLFFQYYFDKGYYIGFALSFVLFVTALFYYKKIDKKITDLL